MSWPTEYDEATCQTAGELRAAGIAVPFSVPDCGWIPRGSMSTRPAPIIQASYDPETGRITAGPIEIVFTVPFQWVEFEVTEVTS